MTAAVRRGVAAAMLGMAMLIGACSNKTEPTSFSPEAKPTLATALEDESSPNDVVTIAAPGTVAIAGTTPMPDRVAVLGVLNKRNGIAREVTLKPGHGVRVGDVVLRLRACEQTAPWEQEHYTGAFVQVDVRELDKHWHRTFSGWLYKERPSLNVVQHPIYDVWTKSCAMTFPEGGPDSVSAGDIAPKPRSSAKKSPDGGDVGGNSDDTAGSTAPPSAAPSNAT